MESVNMLRRSKIKKAITITVIVLIVLAIPILFYFDLKGKAAENGYEFNIFHTEHDFYYDIDEQYHTRVYTCGCYNFGVRMPHRYIKSSKKCDICKFSGYYKFWD